MIPRMNAVYPVYSLALDFRTWRVFLGGNQMSEVGKHINVNDIKRYDQFQKMVYGENCDE
jgi:hypothetical protein